MNPARSWSASPGSPRDTGRDPATTAQAFTGGWLHSGKIAKSIIRQEYTNMARRYARVR